MNCNLIIIELFLILRTKFILRQLFCCEKGELILDQSLVVNPGGCN